MPVLNVGPSLYGAARALQDTERMKQQEQAFNTDQQLRQEQIAEAPLRRRVLEGYANREDAQATLDSMNIDIAKLKKKDLEQATAEAMKARDIHGKLVEGVRGFQATGDPDYVVKAFQGIDPERYGKATAKRNDDGTITLDGGGGRPITFRGQTKLPDGSTLSPEDELVHYVSAYEDPVKALQEKYNYAQKVGIEGAKNQRAIEVARIGAASREKVAGGKRSDAWENQQYRQIKPVLDSMLKTTGVSGSFIAGYAHENDAELRGLIEEGVEGEIANGTPVREASRHVIDDVRETYDKANKLATDSAKALAKKKIKPTDLDAVQAAAKSGDKDAQALLKVLAASREAMGASVAKYLQSQLPTK